MFRGDKGRGEVFGVKVGERSASGKRAEDRMVWGKSRNERDSGKEVSDGNNWETGQEKDLGARSQKYLE